MPSNVSSRYPLMYLSVLHDVETKYHKAKSGVYCGPLRLLAHELYERLNSSVRCSLVTGQQTKVSNAGVVERFYSPGILAC